MAKILLINNGYPTESKTQYCTYIESIKAGLESAGHNVDLCVMDVDFNNKYRKVVKYLIFFKKLFFADFLSYDYVFLHHYSYYAFIINRKLKKVMRPVLHWHGGDLFPNKKILSFIFNYYYKNLPTQTKHITPSLYFKNTLSHKYHIPLKNIEVSPSGGVDMSVFQPIKNRFNPDNTIKLGFASGLLEEKGVDMVVELLKAQNEIEDKTKKKIEMHYIFYGKTKSQYGKILESFSNTVRWKVMQKSKMVEFYNAIDLLLFPTTRKSESLGLVALEAMSCGCPVVGTNDFALKEYIINDKSGELFDMGNKKYFRSKVIKAINNLDKYKPQEIVEKQYSNKIVVEFYKKYFEVY